MFIHENPSHLWFNLILQLTFAWFAGFHHSGLVGHLEMLLVYLLSGFGGGVAFKIVETSSDQVSLVGSSAGVFGLAGLCVIDSAVDTVQFLMNGFGRERPQVMNYYYSLNQVSRLGYMEKKRMMFISRTISVILVVAYNVYEIFEGNEEKKISVMVHFAGFFSGIIVGGILIMCRLIYRTISIKIRSKSIIDISVIGKTSAETNDIAMSKLFAKP